ncbi:MAG: GNAT family N-acetyltransferase [candidate division Zixibacteria bacterium]|nr:GNAT family N-acetyltransferase [candidate division Zixibacteria bacterium]
MTDIRVIPESDWGRFLDIMVMAYPVFDVKTAEERKKLRERFDRSSRDDRVSLYGYYRDEQLLGGLKLYDYSMNLFGRMVLAGGGGSLAVDLLHKKQHVAKDLMLFFFRHYRDRGAPMALLWPFRPDFYRRMGAGYSSKIHQYAVKPKHLPTGPSCEHVRFLGPEDIPAINDCHNRLVTRTTGMIEETLIGREIEFERNKKWKYLGCEHDGRIDGYLMFQFERGNPENFVDNHIHVLHMIYETPEALLELMTFLHSQLDQINRVIIDSYDDDFHFLPTNPRNRSGRMIPPVHHECHRSGVGIMYRVLSLPHLFEALTDRHFDGDNQTIGFDLSDTFLPENDDRYNIVFEDGRARFDKTGSSQVDIALSVADFSSLIMGAVNFRSLIQYSLATISDNSQLDAIDRLFSVHRKPVTFADF